MDKVLLILVDGMRPDSIAACGSEYADNMLKNCRYKDMQAKTVFPSVTLPCHMSLFHAAAAWDTDEYVRAHGAARGWAYRKAAQCR